MRLQQLLITLVAKAINGSHKNISASQHSLAEITELIHAAHLIHFGVIDLKERDHNLEYGNKIGILCGDLLLAHSSVELAALQNQKVAHPSCDLTNDKPNQTKPNSKIVYFTHPGCFANWSSTCSHEHLSFCGVSSEQ